MESISVFDIFKIGVGPSSSHTMGPWRAAQRFLTVCRTAGKLSHVQRIRIDLYGSLAKTGRGHGTDIAILLGLLGEDPVTCDTASLHSKVDQIKASHCLPLAGDLEIEFIYERDLVFHFDQSLPFHPNGLSFSLVDSAGAEYSQTYYSIGGGFVIQEEDAQAGENPVRLPFPIEQAEDLQRYCHTHDLTVPEVVRENERTWRSDDQINRDLDRIWHEMQQCMYRGCTTRGTLPGGLRVVRRAAALNKRLLGDYEFASPGEWLEAVSETGRTFQEVLQWVSCFALAVNEENAAFGRVVTAPTNGAAGVIPAVLAYFIAFCNATPEKVRDFLLTAGEIGSIFKKGATISAAMGGCQAEIGVSSAMAAGALTQGLGGTVDHILMAAEIAMEHHLGMTCDPAGGLVQIPCIERNTMGSIKAITAANIALASNPADARVTLDMVVKAMWETALDMNTRYKETSEGGLALHIPVSLIEC